MTPLYLAMICATSCGALMIFATFVYKWLLSRDKKLNDEAQRKALAHETEQLKLMRQEIMALEPFSAHYMMLDENKEAIHYLDEQIQIILDKKQALITRYADTSLVEAQNIVNTNETSVERKDNYDQLRQEIDGKLKAYDAEIGDLQERRGKLWTKHGYFQKTLLDQETLRNERLHELYTQHAAVLEKVFLRHIENEEAVTLKGMESGAQSFKEMLMAPIQFMMQFFTTTIEPLFSWSKAKEEFGARSQVAALERAVNQPVVRPLASRPIVEARALAAASA